MQGLAGLSALSSNTATLFAVALALLWLIFVFLIFNRQRKEQLPSSTPSTEQREAAARRLWASYAALPDEEPTTAIFLLEESKKTYEGWVDSNARIEGKATWLSGFLAGGAGLLTVFGSAHGDKASLQPGPFLNVALGAAFATFLFCLYIMRPKLRFHPSVSDYINPVIALSPMSRFHVALSLAEDYNRSIVQIARLRRFDSVAWTAAQASLTLAASAILIHFAIHIGVAASPTSVLQCQGQVNPYHTGTAWKSSCKEQSSGG